MHILSFHEIATSLRATFQFSFFFGKCYTLILLVTCHAFATDMPPVAPGNSGIPLSRSLFALSDEFSRGGGIDSVTPEDSQMNAAPQDPQYLSCGLLSLIFAARSQSISLDDVAHLRERYGKAMLNMAELASAAADIGVRVQCFAARDSNAVNISQVSIPWIAHFKDKHFVCVLETTDGTIRIYDSGRILQMERKRFLDLWTGYGMIVLSQSEDKKAQLADVRRFGGVVFERGIVDLGQVVSGQQEDIDVVLYNLGVSPQIVHLEHSSQIIIPDSTKEWQLPSGGRIDVAMIYVAPHSTQDATESISVVGSTDGTVRDRMTVRASVLPGASSDPPRIVREITRDATPSAEIVNISIPIHHQPTTFHVESDAPWLTMSLSSTDQTSSFHEPSPHEEKSPGDGSLISRWVLAATPAFHLSPGEHKTTIRILDDSNTQIVCEIPFYCTVREACAFRPSILNFGYLQAGKSKTITMMLDSESAFAVSSISAASCYDIKSSFLDGRLNIAVTLRTTPGTTGFHKDEIALSLESATDHECHMIRVPVYAVIHE